MAEPSSSNTIKQKPKANRFRTDTERYEIPQPKQQEIPQPVDVEKLNSGTKIEKKFKSVQLWNRKWNTIEFGGIFFTFQLFFLISGSKFWGESFSSWVAMVYIIMPLGYLVYLKVAEDKIREINFSRTVVLFVLGFLLTWVVVLMIFTVLMDSSLGTVNRDQLWPLIITQVCFVAPCEELAFRVVLPEWLSGKLPKKMYHVAFIISAAAFSLFHVGAYNGSTSSLMIAFLIGLIWTYAYRVKFMDGRLGLGFTIGSHAAYNLCLAGILAGNIAMVVGG